VRVCEAAGDEEASVEVVRPLLVRVRSRGRLRRSGGCGSTVAEKEVRGSRQYGGGCCRGSSTRREEEVLTFCLVAVSEGKGRRGSVSEERERREVAA